MIRAGMAGDASVSTSGREHYGWIVRESGAEDSKHAVLMLPGALASAIFYDDLVEVRTTVVGGSRIKIEHEYEVVVVERAGKTEDIHAMVGSTTLACVDTTGKPRELPDWLARR